MRNLFLLFIVLAAAVVANAQNGYSLYGKVITSAGEPASGASVTLTASDGSPTITQNADEKGEFRFQAPPGNYRLQATLTTNGEIAAAVSTDITIKLGRPEILELRLAQSGPIRETVTVSADREQLTEEVAKTVNIITGLEMRERADFSLVESLRSIPGFRVQQLGGFGKTANIKTRGLRNQDTAMLIDGIRLRDASAITGDATPFLSDLTLTSVSRVEVLRGSGSSLYGTNAIGGVIDLRTPEPADGWRGQISGAFGGLGLGRFRGNISNRFLDNKLGVSTALSRTAYTKGIDGNDNAANTNFQTRIDGEISEMTSVSARFLVSDAKVRLNSNPDTFGLLPMDNISVIRALPGVNFTPDVDDPDDIQRSKFFNGQLIFTHAFSENVVLKAFYSGLTTTRRNDSGPLGVGFQSSSTSIFDGTIQTANAAIEWTAGRHNVRFGYELEDERFGNEGFTPSGSGDFFTKAGQASNTFYAQDLIRLFGGKLQLAGGVRAQFFQLSQPSFSLANAPYAGVSLDDPPAAYTFDGAASYFIRSSGTKLRAHVGNGYRVPSLYERFGTFYSSFGTPSFVALGDPDLKPERSLAFDLGIEQDLAGERIKLAATYFYTQLTEVIGYGNVVRDIGGTPRPFGGYVNQKGGIARGGEFSATFKPSVSTDLFASYTLTKSLQREPQIAGSGTLETLGIPQHQFTLVATQRWRRFWVNVDLLASSSYLAPIFSNSTFNTYVYGFSGNRRADLTAGYTFKLRRDKFDLRLFGTVENLFDDEYYENGFRTAGANGRVGISFGF
jgi:vitamin B12 transporter